MENARALTLPRAPADLRRSGRRSRERWHLVRPRTRRRRDHQVGFGVERGHNRGRGERGKVGCHVLICFTVQRTGAGCRWPPPLHVQTIQVLRRNKMVIGSRLPVLFSRVAVRHPRGRAAGRHCLPGEERDALSSSLSGAASPRFPCPLLALLPVAMAAGRRHAGITGGRYFVYRNSVESHPMCNLRLRSKAGETRLGGRSLRAMTPDRRALIRRGGWLPRRRRRRRRRRRHLSPPP
jgi:hypothetical protein